MWVWLVGTRTNQITHIRQIPIIDTIYTLIYCTEIFIVPFLRGSNIDLAADPPSSIQVDSSRGGRDSSQEEQVGRDSDHSGMKTILRGREIDITSLSTT